MKIIICGCGEIIKLDDEDSTRAANHHWHCYSGPMVRRWHNGKNQPIANYVLYTEGLIDHKDRDKHNNQKDNLRLATKSQNNANQRIRKDNLSGYKGVSWKPRISKYVANIFINGKQTHLGCFLTAEDAALAYNQVAKEQFGEFAVLNQICTPTGVTESKEKQEQLS